MAAAAAAAAGVGSKVANVLKAGLLTTSGLAVVASGGWVMYKDAIRWPRMEYTFASGSILPPVNKHFSQMNYYPRPDVEKELRRALSSENTGHYYVVRGEIGTGKTRSVVHVIKAMMEEEAKQGKGAPVYVLASQGCTFIDALAASVDYYFDEHLNFSYFLDFIFRTQSSKGQDEHHRLARTLHAIEQASRRYYSNRGRPVVLVIDGVDYLADHLPGYLERIQSKAKLWADTGIAKVVFVTSHDRSQNILEKSQTDWSRADAPIFVTDLDQASATKLLKSDLSPDGSGGGALNDYQAKHIHDLVGGRMQDLLYVKRTLAAGVPFAEIRTRLLNKERDKFVDTNMNQEALAGLKKLLAARSKTLPLPEMIATSGEDGLRILLKRGIVRLEREHFNLHVQFESKLTENTVQEYFARR